MGRFVFDDSKVTSEHINWKAMLKHPRHVTQQVSDGKRAVVDLETGEELAYYPCPVGYRPSAPDKENCEAWIAYYGLQEFFVAKAQVSICLDCDDPGAEYLEKL